MRRINILLLLLCLSARPSAGAPLFDMGDKALPGKVRLSDAVVSPVAAGGETVLRIAFGSRSQYPSIRFEPDRLGYSPDWSGAGALAITVSNAGPGAVTLGLRIDSAAATDRGRQASAEISPGKEARLLMPLGSGGAIVGMIGQPPLANAHPWDAHLAPSTAPFDPARIKSFQLFVGRPKEKHAIALRRAELVEAARPKLPFVDRFGQFNGADWPGKLKGAGEFAARREAEAAALAEPSPLAGRNAFGGWEAGPRLEATGRFRVQKHGGKWWLVDPGGRLFWSSGITGVRFNNATRVAGREDFFEWFPPQEDPLARFFAGRGKGRTFDFYAANLFRKFGPDFEAAFFDTATRRMVSWGITTIANWSDERSWLLRRVPYTVPVNTGGPGRFVVSERLKAGQPWIKQFPDPFEPRFEKTLDEKLAALAHLKEDPWMLGVFIDNELPWLENEAGPKRVAAAALDTPAGAPVKAALIRHLRAKGDLAAANKAFGTGFASWEAAEAQPWHLAPDRRAAAEPALAALDAVIAEQYFRTCRDALRRHLPGALYLGCRFHQYNREAIRAAKAYCDVVSFNIYAYDPAEKEADEFAQEMDFPVVIGEFHFGATDRGMFHTGLRKTEDQADRAAKYVAYLTRAAAAPWCVGAHWFQYLDQPLTGRGDGENYNIGFVNVTDDPYPELTAAAREFHGRLYPERAAPRP